MITNAEHCDRSPELPWAARWATVWLAVALAWLAGCSSETPDASPQASTPQNVTLTAVQRQSIHLLTVEPSSYRTTITTTAVVDFDRDRATTVLAPFSGPVTRVPVALGDHVAAGQALAMVNSPDFTIAVGAYRKALITAAAADAVATNDRFLYTHQAISQREDADAQAAAISADADRTAALQGLVALHVDPRTIATIRGAKPLTLGQGTIRAPIAGTVVEKSIAPGQMLAAGTTPCFTIADTSRMWVMAQVFGAEVAQVHPGDAATVDVGDGEAPLVGSVTNVAAVVDPDTRAVGARVQVDNPDGVLKRQMYVQVHIQSHAQYRGLLIPVSAVLRDDENLPFVYVLAADGSYARRSVTLGARVDDRFVIPQGLQSGDQVVVDGGIFLRFIQTQ
ncbi:MAG TPA: efflux RND transporter periplasmic adaptor subunit [Steroidobacteraceae bacterium]|jgi:cobalt-zinc-cadmium efflux system membrane fusion protein|nr:efflux RND transporter periplasmic adaptor subunit [Steroidobacteraceae bacterium]